MGSRPQLLLLDACAIIGAFECGGWTAIHTQYEIIVPSIVAEEATHYRDAAGSIVYIDMQAEAQAGHIRVCEVPTETIAKCIARLRDGLRERLHPGETEALAFLVDDNSGGVCFITGDVPAIEAAVALDLYSQMMSLESALLQIGLKRTIRPDLTEAHMKYAREQASARKIQGLL